MSTDKNNKPDKPETKKGQIIAMAFIIVKRGLKFSIKKAVWIK